MGNRNKRTRRLGTIQKRLLTLLLGGVSLGFSKNPQQQLAIIRGVIKEWKNTPNNTLNRAIGNLYEARFIEKKKRKDGSIEIILTKNGRKRAIIESPDALSITKPRKWDGYFWIVLFDIPENKKKVRDAFRFHLKKMKFYELQKSVFVIPFPCAKEIKFLVEYYNARKNVRLIEARSIDHEKEIMKHFKLS